MTWRTLLISSIGATILSCAPAADKETESTESTAEYDQDRDGIIDAHEGDDDSDGDGIPNYLDSDSDNDCISDRDERGTDDEWALPADSDHDGLYDFLDTDSDDNGLSDTEEAGDCEHPVDTDGDGVLDTADGDNDGDNIPDVEDGVADWDGDGLPNMLDTDSDDDCIGDIFEAGDERWDTAPMDTDEDGHPDFLDLDSDDDGLDDEDEIAGACDPPGDMDGDGYLNHVDPDIDGDGLSNVREALMGTNPRKRDTDGDGYSDGLEDFAETSVLDDRHFPEGTVIEMGPRDTVEEVDEYTFTNVTVDIFLLVDTAYSYSCYHPRIPDFLEQLVEYLLLVYDDLALGFGTYDDYAIPGWNASGGLPYKMAHQISTDGDSILEEARLHNMVYGGDAAGSAFEALYQASTGAGFDHNCNSSFDSSHDVKPFYAEATDAFGGECSPSYDVDVEGTGKRKGVGFRPGSLPVFMLAADNHMRDVDMGDDMPEGTCGVAASRADAVSAIRSLGAKVLGINVYEYWSSDTTLLGQLTALAESTDSYIDADDNGIKDDPAVLWGSWNWPPIESVVDALWDLAEEHSFEGSFQIGEDNNNWITWFEATEYTEIEQGDTIDLEYQVTTSALLKPDDQFYRASLELVDEDGEVVTTHWIWVQILPNHRI
jgi:hypothetical protein